MRPEANKYDLIAEEFISSGLTLRLNVALPWPELLDWKNNPWRRRNASGFNVFGLMSLAEERGYKSPFWVYLRDGEAAGGALRPKAKGVNIAAWRWSRPEAGILGEIGAMDSEEIEEEIEEAEEGQEAPVIALRPKVVFNVEEWENLPRELVPPFEGRQIPTREEALKKAQQIEAAAGCEILHNSNTAFYNPSLNQICMPPKDFYKSLKDYYWALFEQIAHALGNRRQLDAWKLPPEAQLAKDVEFKTLYAKMTAAMLVYEAGVDVL